MRRDDLTSEIRYYRHLCCACVFPEGLLLLLLRLDPLSIAFPAP
jgi:hypothetical protein